MKKSKTSRRGVAQGYVMVGVAVFTAGVWLKHGAENALIMAGISIVLIGVTKLAHVDFKWDSED